MQQVRGANPGQGAEGERGLTTVLNGYRTEWALLFGESFDGIPDRDTSLCRRTTRSCKQIFERWVGALRATLHLG